MIQKTQRKSPPILLLKPNGENLEQLAKKSSVEETQKEKPHISRSSMTAHKPQEQEYNSGKKPLNREYTITPTANEPLTQKTKQKWAYGIESVVEKGLHAINSFTHPLSPTVRIESIAEKVKQLYHKATEYAKSLFQPPQDKTYKYQ